MPMKDYIIPFVLGLTISGLATGWYLDHRKLKREIAEWKWALNLVDPVRIQAEIPPEEIMPNPHK